MVSGEELLIAFQQSLEEEFPLLLETYYGETNQDWLKAPVTLTLRDNIDTPRLPHAHMTIEKNRLKREDRYIDRGEFTLTLRITFMDTDPPMKGYRYHLVLSELLKTSTLLKEKVDYLILEEFLYSPERMIKGEPSEIEFQILLINEEWIPF